MPTKRTLFAFAYKDSGISNKSMASPIAHTLAGLGLFHVVHGHQPKELGRPRWKALAPFLLLPHLPDVDFLISYLLYQNARFLHGEITHTPLFAILAALLIMPFRLFGSRLRTFILAAILIASHAFIDMSSGQPFIGSPGIGVMLFYPLSTQRFSLPITLFYGIRHQTLQGLLSIHNLFAVLLDTLYVILYIITYKIFTVRPYALYKRRKGNK